MISLVNCNAQTNRFTSHNSVSKYPKYLSSLSQFRMKPYYRVRNFQPLGTHFTYIETGETFLSVSFDERRHTIKKFALSFFYTHGKSYFPTKLCFSFEHRQINMKLKSITYICIQIIWGEKNNIFYMHILANFDIRVCKRTVLLLTPLLNNRSVIIIYYNYNIIIILITTTPRQCFSQLRAMCDTRLGDNVSLNT